MRLEPEHGGVGQADPRELVVLFGLMILSAQFAACGFYDWCSARIATAALPPAALLAITVAAAGILAAVLANDVVVFAMTPMLCASGRSPCRDRRREDDEDEAGQTRRIMPAADLPGAASGLGGLS